MRIDPDEPAFARAGDEINKPTDGLTVRAYMATQIMTTMLPGYSVTNPEVFIAERAVRYTDALIAELNKGGAK
jgi:hypothetical protein